MIQHFHLMICFFFFKFLVFWIFFFQKFLQSSNFSSPNFIQNNYFVSGVYGGLDLHGKAPAYKWSRLAATASSGDTTLQLADAVDWQAGDEVTIAFFFFFFSLGGRVVLRLDFSHLAIQQFLMSSCYITMLDVLRLVNLVSI